MKLSSTMKAFLALTMMIVLSIALSFFISKLSFMSNFEDQLVSLRFEWKNHLKPAEKVKEGVVKEGEKVKSDLMIIGIDEISLGSDFLGPWPWERKTHGEFLKYFNYQDKKYDPHYILFDIFFDQYRISKADGGYLKKFAAQLYQSAPHQWQKNPKVYEEKVFEVNQQMANSDTEFFKELKNHNNLFFDYLSQYGEEERLKPEELAPRYKYLEATKLEVLNPDTYLEAKEANERYPIISDIKPPVVEVLSHSIGTGSAWTEADRDGSIRKMPLVFLFYDNRIIKDPVFLPTIDMIFIMKYFSVEPKNVEVNFGHYIKLKNAKVPLKKKLEEGGYQITGYDEKDISIPIDGEGKMHINFQGVSHSFDNMSYAYINADTERSNAALYQGRVLLIGFYSTAGLGETKDYFNTPYGSMYGIEIHANALYTILNQEFLKTVPQWIQYLFVVLLIIGLAITLYFMNVIKGMIFGVLILLLVFIGGNFIFSGAIFSLNVTTAPLYLMNLVHPLSAVLISLLLNISYKVLIEEKDKKFLKSTFSQYISPELIDIMYEEKTTPQLGGSSDILTAYFTDIQGFSSFSEKLTATQLVELLNEYLTTMTDILTSARGTLDKYEGDAIIAFFGAPMKLPDNAVRACRVALEMQAALGNLREKWKNEKSDEDRNTKKVPASDWVPGYKWPVIVHDMRMRIGLNTGEIVTGNMGSKMRMNYTMMGDSVNLAARLESGAKQYGVYTMMSEYTYEFEYTDEDGVKHRLKDLFEVRFLDKLTVVGKSLPVSVFELIALKGQLTEEQARMLKTFKEGMDLYQETKWDEAKAKFEESAKIELFPKNKVNPSKVFIARCEEFKLNPPVKPGEKWDGVYRLTSK